jgi:hypothetical protein
MFLDPYNYELDLEVQKEEAFEDGANKKAEESAVNLLKKGVSETMIAECIGLPLEKVIELAETIKK